MRDITKVIDDMLAIIPDEISDHASPHLLRERLQDIKVRAVYTAPEVIGDRWAEAADILNLLLPAPSELNGWQTKVVAVWTGKAQ